MRRRVVVAGGGLAGIAAAVEAARRGATVTLVERRPFLGGRAFSFTDAQVGEIDNGQHVFLGCCTAYRSLLATIGAAGDTVTQPALRAVIQDRAGMRGVLRADRLPAPGHMLPSFLTYRLLTARERARAVPAVLALMRARIDADLDEITFGEWLERRGQSPRVVERFWDVIVLATCNDRSARVSAALAAFVFQEGVFRTRTGSAIGWSRVGLTRLVDGPVRRALQGLGGSVRTGVAVERLDEGRVVLSDGEELPADGVVLALPPERVRRACPDALPVDPDLGASPIVNVHLWFDRPVMDDPFVAVVDSPAQWIFNRSAMDLAPDPRDPRGTPDGASHAGYQVTVSISGARDEVSRPRSQLLVAIGAEIRALFPAAAQADLLHGHVVKEPNATFAAAPGQGSRRPGVRTPVPGVTIAGAWTATGWPATMEGAARSGIAAARALTDGL